MVHHEWSRGRFSGAPPIVGVHAVRSVGKRQVFVAEILATLTFFATFNGTIGIVTSISNTEIGFWNVLVPVWFLSVAASTTASYLGTGYSVCAALKAGIIETAILFGIQLLVLLFIMANLQIESETTRAIISGFVYPAGEVLLKFMYRKVCLGHHETVENGAADTEIKEQVFIYVSRNLEIGLAKPNFTSCIFSKRNLHSWVHWRWHPCAKFAVFLLQTCALLKWGRISRIEYPNER